MQIGLIILRITAYQQIAKETDFLTGNDSEKLLKIYVMILSLSECVATKKDQKRSETLKK
jgi:hypothetical protein